tara:strand:+ start:342 stop:518 length:177 start_codon:yes stop_codon:yes gene_type:complete
MNWKYSKRRFAMNKFRYTVEWDGDGINYKQDFETIEDARIALAVHHRRNARLLIKRKE